MPRLKKRQPSLCKHKASGQAVVTLDGRDLLPRSLRLNIRRGRIQPAPGPSGSAVI